MRDGTCSTNEHSIRKLRKRITTTIDINSLTKFKTLFINSLFVMNSFRIAQFNCPIIPNNDLGRPCATVILRRSTSKVMKKEKTFKEDGIQIRPVPPRICLSQYTSIATMISVFIGIIRIHKN